MNPFWMMLLQRAAQTQQQIPVDQMQQARPGVGQTLMDMWMSLMMHELAVSMRKRKYTAQIKLLL